MPKGWLVVRGAQSGKECQVLHDFLAEQLAENAINRQLCIISSYM